MAEWRYSCTPTATWR